MKCLPDTKSQINKCQNFVHSSQWHTSSSVSFILLYKK